MHSIMDVTSIINKEVLRDYIQVKYADNNIDYCWLVLYENSSSIWFYNKAWGEDVELEIPTYLFDYNVNDPYAIARDIVLYLFEQDKKKELEKIKKEKERKQLELIANNERQYKEYLKLKEIFEGKENG